MVIAFEGMDGVGKTSVAKKVSEILNIEYASDPIQKFLGLSDEEYRVMIKMIRNMENDKIALIYYVLRHMIARQSKDEYKIVDRSMASTYYFESKKVEPTFFEEINKLGCNADFTIVLYANVNKRIERMKKRNENDEDLKNKESLQDGYELMLEYLNKFNLPYVVIDTSYLSFEDSVMECINTINNYLSFEKNKVKRL